MLKLSSGVSAFVLSVAGLVAAPYLLIWLACRNLQFWFARVVIALALAGCCVLGVYAFDAVSEDAQGGLNIIFASIYQPAGNDEVAAVMSGVPITARQDETLGRVANLMLKHQVHHIPIVNSNKKLVGMVSSIEFVRLAADGQGD
ncbi:CBS domain protein [Rubripirellula tenax]|uniref:CBS domain protein n=1 Tax=Rubripirellula tenax TaxID=2528015 RepID=A0A5C6E7H1_9BACT|nr:CBS domain-containing protein [Rubripirellula tenax]TWU44515.1 CBS domain protein [Rubripirellula tenax]